MGLFLLYCVYYVYSLLGFEKISHNCVDFLSKISIMISEGEINVLTKFQFKKDFNHSPAPFAVDNPGKLTFIFC